MQSSPATFEGLPELRAAGALLSDTKAVACRLADELASIAPRLLHAVTFFSGPASIEITAAAARVGSTSIDVAGLAESYARSAVQWNRWSVTEAERDRFAPVGARKPSALSSYWNARRSSWQLGEYRRRVVCNGDRAIALVGSTVLDDRDVAAEVWEALADRIEASILALRLAAFAGGAANDGAADGVVALLSPEGVTLAAPADAEVAAATTVAQRAIRSGRIERSFAALGKSYRLRPSASVRSAEVFELVSIPQGSRAELSERDAELVEWVHRGLTNREVAAMLGVPVTTVKKTLERLFARHGASNRVELLRLLDDRVTGIDGPHPAMKGRAISYERHVSCDGRA